MKLNKMIIMTTLALTMTCSIQATVIEEVKENIEVEAGATETEKHITKTIAEETKIRESASPIADIILYLGENEEVEVIEKYGDFYKVKSKGLEGYIYKTQIDTSNLEMFADVNSEIEEVKEATEEVTEETIKEDIKEVIKEVTKGEEIVAFAKKYLGGKYVYGGNSLTTGVDCSGFTQQIMKQFGINIARTSKAQYTSSGVKVSISDVRAGDLVFYGSNGVTVDHVAIYAGDGQIIHASDARSGIKMSKLNYGKPIIGVKRVIN